MKILDFYADWCGPCNAMKPTMKSLEEEGYDIEKIDIEDDAGRAKAQEYGVMSIPTLVFLDSDKEVARINGQTSKDAILKFLVD